MTERGFREFDVSDDAVKLGRRLGLPNPEVTVAQMASAHVPSQFGRQYIRNGIFIMRVENSTVMWIGLGPASWRTSEMYFNQP